ncbi:ARP2/3 complex 20 kDa subunit (ARPC4) domain-containing protein [Ditylenchus destructor]|uniref:ARP2/3 complex 20 kDa subunit (ARPC4) domain-containing protein n=1 Tax=Ditylenchus destructor TaxID=166010 RepID=A0AAD4R7Z4_9BILA|nr:ARP2/3 complex 20 kDa subunit (ARPC4) domain-containing protein [Ditylenchus destructor]
MTTTLQPYLEAVRKTLEAALCLQQFGSQVVERHNKPEVEVRASKELLMTPVVVSRNKQERVLIEPSINSVRISIGVKQADEIEKILCNKFTKFMCQRADNFIILRRKPISGYDISFLITTTHTEIMYKHKLIDFLIHFMQEVDKEISEMKIALNARGRASAEEFLKRRLSFTFIVLSILYCAVCYASDMQEIENDDQNFSIQGRASLRPEMISPSNWWAKSRVLVNYGKYIGFVREDGSFVVDGVPSGSYIVEISNTDYIFEPVRVDITSKGKIRARRLNLLQPNTVNTIPYPLQLVARQPARYFRTREEWRITDVLMNPMVIMLLVAFFLLIVTPKLAGSQDKADMQVQMPKMDMPDMADMLASLFGGDGKKGSAKKAVGPPSKKTR